MKKNHLQFLNGKRSDNLKYWKHSLFVIYVSMFHFSICYLLVRFEVILDLEFLNNCFNYYFNV